MLEVLYKRTKTGAVQSWMIVVEGNTFYTIEGQVNGVLTTSLPTVCEGKNPGKKNETTGEQQAIKEAEAKWKKKTENGYTTDVNAIDTAMKHFEPMLCATYEEGTIDFGQRVFSQPKLDGMRCICKADGMWSRGGKPIVSAPHIFEALKPLFEKNPDLIFDGELYTNKFKNDFNSIISLCKKSKPTQADLDESAKSIQYWVYDLPSCEDVFWRRNEKLEEVLGTLASCTDIIEIVKTIEVHGQEQLDALYGQYLEEGYEGQIIRYNEKYENKRTKSILKRKTFQDREYFAIGTEEGEGGRTGTIGKVFCRDEETGKEFKSNVKGNFTYLKQLWQDRESLVGKKVTVKFFNLTPDGIPRFPYIIGVRDYE